MDKYPREYFGDRLNRLENHNINYFTSWSEESARIAFNQIYPMILNTN